MIIIFSRRKQLDHSMQLHLMKIKINKKVTQQLRLGEYCLLIDQSNNFHSADLP